ncbi:MAG: hypothetical protein PUE61_05095 [Clostridiales bacterium]|nr:hypothetical protein [Clostridiales bacterium]
MKKTAFPILLILFSLFLALPALAFEDEEEIHFRTPAPRPILQVQSPKNGSSWEKGGKLTVEASCEGAEAIEAVLRFPDGMELTMAGGANFSHVFAQDAQAGEYFTTGAELILTARMPDGQSAVAEVEIISPKDQLIKDMFAEALANSKDKRYKFAPAQDDWHVGVCKNFVMRLFDTYSPAYRMAEYPDLELYMPKNKSKADSAPYDYGIEWRPEGPVDGAPFEIAAQFKYDPALSKEENMALCREVLHSVQRGDFFQMVGYYYYGNGPHSLLFMSDYDPVTDEVHWTDSNMKGERVDGVRWGYIQYDAVKTAEWFVEAICTKNRGCTIYRLRDDLYVQ